MSGAERRLQPLQLRLGIERPSVLAIRRRLRVEPLDRTVCLRDDVLEPSVQPYPGQRRRTRGRRPRQQHIPPIQELADLLVRLDPRRRHACVAEHPEPEGALPGRRVVIERDRHPPVGQLVERAVFHRLADLPLDDALPRRTERDLALAVASLRHHGQIVAAA